MAPNKMDLCYHLWQDGGGLNNTATVLIHVEDTDNLDPYFSHDTYQAFIAENEVSPKTSFW